MENIIHREEVELDSKRLRTFNEQIRKTDNINTYNEVEQRITDFNKQNKNTMNEFQFDILDKFMEYCKEYYK